MYVFVYTHSLYNRKSKHVGKLWNLGDNDVSMSINQF